MIDVGDDVVRRKLGEASARLYVRVVALLESASTEAVSDAVREVIQNLICGEYHDFRSTKAMPKAEFVEALRWVASSPATIAVIGERLTQEAVDLIAAVLRGDFDEDDIEALRWSEAETPPPQPAPEVVPIHDITATPKQIQVLAAMVDLVAEFGRPPSLREIAERSGVSMSDTGRAVNALHRLGAVTNIGGHRCWVPTRQP